MFDAPLASLILDIENLIYCHCGNEDDPKKEFPALLRDRRRVYGRGEAVENTSSYSALSLLR